MPTPQIVATKLISVRYQTSGLDIGVNYGHKIQNYGAMKYDFIGTYVKKFIQEPLPGLGTFDCVGLHGNTCGAPQPEWRHKIRATWETPWSFDVSATWRHIGKSSFEGTSTSPVAGGNSPRAGSRPSASATTSTSPHHGRSRRKSRCVAVSTTCSTKIRLFRVSAGAGFGNGNTYPQVYDALGRRVFFNATASF